MKIKEFIGKAWSAIAGWFSTKVETLPATVTVDEIDHVIKIVENIKKAVNSPFAILATTLIPGTIDDAIRTKLSDFLPQLLAGLTFAKDSKVSYNSETVLDDLLKKIRFSDKEDQDALYHSMASRLLIIVSDGRVTWTEAIGAVEYYFKNIFLKAV
ncbi:hypothetical protein J3L18_23215 [Mucilaginibacter gossypii]|uniref:hypothetical protein n=1 Tax=Mucilaginibacter gossypii TaxID=551996 RepID=UPI000DCAEE11|nr:MULTISPECIES: hypothetical protein [Mucilaginibacter]QTE36025.1 hypothetical protein J3L18_23215 [Mucilaginibacter gossypii]RAV56699.1 hypothetical protein DIU36_14960 [Mucilaginibacter rubeus]